EGTPLPQLETQGAVARQIAGAGENQITDSGESCRGQSITTEGDRKPGHLSDASGDQCSPRVVSKAETIASTRRNRDNVLQRTTNLHTHRISARVNAKP